MARLSIRIGFQKGLLIIVTTLLLPALLSGIFSDRVDAGEKDTLVLARAMDINSLDPHNAWCDTCKVVIGLMYETLVKLGPDNRTILPQIAKSWEISKDGMTFTFHLDERAVFSDGSPVEAKDAKWSLERLKNMAAGPDIYAKSIAKMETPDPRTLVMTVSGWPSELLAQLVVPYAGIVNSDVAIAHGAVSSTDASAKDKSEPWFMKNSAGSSPFILDTYRPDEEIRLKRNEKYWGKKPAISNIIIKHVADAVSQAQMLESGMVDIAMQIDADTAKTIKSKDVVVKSQPSYYFNYLALVPGASNLEVPLTPKVREAIALAMDYQGLIDVTVGGAGRIQPSVIPVEFPGGSGLPVPEQDLAGAKKLLAEAGCPDGFEILAVYPNITSYGVNYGIVMQKVQQDLAKVGIKVKLEPVSFAVLRTRIQGTIPMTVLMWAADYVGSAPYVQYFSMTPGSRWYYLASGASHDLKELISPREVELMEKLQKANAEEAARLYHEFAKEMIKDHIVIPVGNPNLLLTYRKDVKGMRYDVITELAFDEISKE